VERRIIKSINTLVVFLLLYSLSVFSQTITISAGINQIINWEQTHSAQLNGRVSSDDIKVE
jgi:hypothetical protein